MLHSHLRFSGFNFVSRRGAEEAEAAESFVRKAQNNSALSASSAPLRETDSALRAGAMV
jgi:hypothetical protein